MILFYARKRYATCSSDDRLTTGSVGVEVVFHFSDDWAAAPARIAVFRGSGVSVDVALLEDSCTVPPEVLTQPGSTLSIGVYGTDGAGKVVIPTVYAEAGRIVRGAEPSGVEPTPETQPLIDQLLAAAKAARDAAGAAERLAQSVRDDADRGEFNGTRIWWTTARVLPYGSGGGVATRQLNGVDGATPAVRDYVFAPEIEQSGEPTTVYVITQTTAVVTAFDRLCRIKGNNGTSPTVAITEITGGHRITITSAAHPEGQSFDVMDGTGGGVTVDDALSGSSTNPVQNKVVKAALAAKGTYSKPPDGIPKTDLASGVIPSASSATPQALGTAAAGSSTNYSRADHKHDFNSDFITALLQIASKVAYIDGNGQTYYDALEASLTHRTLSSISAVYTQSGTVYPDTSLDSLKTDLVVTATYSDSSMATVAATDYTLSGTLTEGTSTITVSYGGKTTTFSVTVSSPYVHYDYLVNTRASTSDNNDYVDTGLVHSPSWATLNIELEAMNSNTDSKVVSLLGAGHSLSTPNTGAFIWYARSNKAGFSTFSLGNAKQIANAPGDTRCVVKYVFVDGGESYIEYGGAQTAVATKNKSQLSNITDPLFLAGGYESNGVGLYGMRGNGMAKLGYVKFTDPETDELLYHFIPAYNNATAKWGYHEVIHDVFYPANTDGYLQGGNWGA